MVDKIESSGHTGLKLVERGAVPIQTLKGFGKFFTPDSSTPDKDPLAIAFCAASALDFAELNERTQYRILDTAGRSRKEALGMVLSKIPLPNIQEALAAVENRGENRQVSGRAALIYFFAARMLKKDFPVKTDESNLRRQLELFVFTGDRVTGNLSLGGFSINDAEKDIKEFVVRVREIEISLIGNQAREAI